jgi:hypothetical protein
MNNPLCKSPFDRVACIITPAPRELTPVEVRRVHVLHLRAASARKAVAFIDAKIQHILKSYGL